MSCLDFLSRYCLQNVSCRVKSLSQTLNSCLLQDWFNYKLNRTCFIFISSQARVAINFSIPSRSVMRFSLQTPSDHPSLSPFPTLSNNLLILGLLYLVFQYTKLCKRNTAGNFWHSLQKFGDIIIVNMISNPKNVGLSFFLFYFMQIT